MLNILWRKTIDFEAIYTDILKDNLPIHLTGIGETSTLKNAAHKCHYYLDDSAIKYTAVHIVTEWYEQIAISWFIVESRELACAVYFAELGNSPSNDIIMQLSAQSQIIDLTEGKTIFAPIDAVKYRAMQAAWTAYPEYLKQIQKLNYRTPSEIIKNDISNAVRKLTEQG